jgi:hypothetical protein
MWQKFVDSDRPQVKIWLMRFACRLNKATDKHLKCVILITFHCTVVIGTRLNVTSIRVCTLTAFLYLKILEVHTRFVIPHPHRK